MRKDVDRISISGTLTSLIFSLPFHRKPEMLDFHDADTDTDTDILARILAETSDARFPEVIPTASSTIRRHSRDDPREDVGEEVCVGVGVRVRVGAVECQLKGYVIPTTITEVSSIGRSRHFRRKSQNTARHWRIPSTIVNSVQQELSCLKRIDNTLNYIHLY